MRQEFTALGWLGVFGALLAVALFNVAFEWLWRLGDKLERRSVPVVVPHREQAPAN
jgi:hypothetical protein